MSIEAMKIEGPLHVVCQCDKCKAEKQEPFGYFQYSMHMDAWVQNRDSNKGVAFYTYPQPQRERVVFPTMLRKMWSGGEVQAWLDENVNKEKNT